METEEKDTKPRYGTVSFERRKYPRFSVDLPVEYYQSNSSISHTGRAFNASDGGLFLYLTEQVEIGQHLRVKLFVTSGSDLSTIQILGEVGWAEIYLGEAWGDYRIGVKFVDISQENLNMLKSFLGSLSSPDGDES
jgi:c-di-GMP-binding flagellar brake protein YcgR